jgi:hypothetical protein
MVSRPGRPKAADIRDDEMLAVVEDYAMHGGPFPTDAFPNLPGKVIVQKLRRAQERGWVDVHKYEGAPRYILTPKGRAVLEGK